jgi:hypothetical protein
MYEYSQWASELSELKCVSRIIAVGAMKGRKIFSMIESRAKF